MAHIVRIDKKPSAKGGNTHGWQVRWNPTGQGRKYNSRLFSDSKWGGRAEAYVEAHRFCQKIEFEVEPVGSLPFRTTEMSNNTSGVNGVCRTHCFFKGTRTRRYFWMAFVTIDRFGKKANRSQRFYIDIYGEAEAKALAIEFRKGWEAAAAKGREAVVRYFESWELI